MSIFAILGVIISTAAMLIVLSGFSGLKSYSLEFISSISPELKISAAKGKTFEFTPEIKSFLEKENIKYGLSYEDKALISVNENNRIVRVIGLDQGFPEKNIDSIMYQGRWFNVGENEIVFQANRSEIKAVNTNKGITLSLPKDEPKKVENINAFTEALNTNVLEVYRGIDDFVAVLNDEEAIKNNNPDFSLIKLMDSRGLIVTAKGNEVDFVSRWYGPQTGIDEDPATGSAHALLATYWSKVLNKQAMSARQLSKRVGHLDCFMKKDVVEITGQAKLYLKGTLQAS